jgi:molybdopterin-containing oxidoreductase family iron-sulfur binding subunit
MKTSKSPEAGREPKYWRSLDELSDSPSFRPWVEREFPEGASELLDPQSRREFVKVMGASLLLGGLATGCRRPVEHIEPYAKLPDGYIHGVAEHYATSMPTRSGAIPLVVRAHEGRPVKIEGNAQPSIPGWHGATTVHAQASILDLYDPDRSMRYVLNGSSAPREVALNSLNTLATQLGQGNGLAFLAERSFSPTRLRLQKLIAQKYPQSKWYVYEAGEAQAINGLKARPIYHFEKATRILSLDCDFLGSEDESLRNSRGFADGRKVTKPGDPMNRLYVVEALMTLTGAAADHRNRKAAGAIPAFALELAEAIVNKQAAKDTWAAECAADLLSAPGKALVVAGYRQPAAVHALAHAMNAALGAEGQTVTWMPMADSPEGSIGELVQSLNGGQVGTLVVLGGNPAATAPADLNFSDAQKKAKNVIRVGYYEDETSEGVSHYAEAHYLESWGDTRTADGRVCAVQPLIAPLFGGVTQIEVLARLAGLPEVTPYALARATFAELAGGNSEEAWKKFLHDGYLAGAEQKPVSAGVSAAQFFEAGKGSIKAPSAIGKDALEVIFYRDAKVDDGRYNNNSWMQELPDSISKASWDNLIYVSKKTADELGLTYAVFEGSNTAGHGLEKFPQKETAENMVPVVTVTVGGKSVTGPVWVQPGQADYTVAIAVGYGRRKTGRVGTGVGFDANPIRSVASPFLAVGAQVKATGDRYRIALTQEHWAMEGRPIVREANYEKFQEKPEFAKLYNIEEPPGGNRPLYPNPFDEVKKTALHQWGMSIDLNSCTGCNACMVACQSENNIPVVGKKQVANGREMYWIRIDRYFTGTVADPQVVNQPMLCQHCESAPCENVCPVNATSHDHEGLNVMTYNRCVGTRYCSNNCPYKVRRFNYFDYNKRAVGGNREYEFPLTTVNKDGSWELLNWFKNVDKSNKPAEEWELLKLVKNPDVSVRMRGVMEKCTYCTQRIEGAKIAQKVKAKSSGDIVVPDGTFTTACAQACPTGAIVFGNIADPESQVSKAKNQARTYGVLEFLLTKPRTTYLARVRNPNPKMPGGEALPYSSKEFNDYMGDPDNPHGHGAAHGQGAHADGHATESHAAPAAAKGAH